MFVRMLMSSKLKDAALAFVMLANITTAGSCQG